MDGGFRHIFITTNRPDLLFFTPSLPIISLPAARRNELSLALILNDRHRLLSVSAIDRRRIFVMLIQARHIADDRATAFVDPDVLHGDLPFARPRLWSHCGHGSKREVCVIVLQSSQE